MAGLLAGLSAKAQTTMSNFLVGPSLGFGHTYFVPYSSDVEFQPMYSAGVTTLFTPNDWFGLATDVRSSAEGRLWDDGRKQSDIRLEYIRIPVKGTVFFAARGENVRPKLTLGPSLGLLVNETGTVDRQRAESVDFGMNASGGFDFKVNEDVFITDEANYYQGFIKNRPNYSKNEYNGNIGLQVGVIFAVPGE